MASRTIYTCDRCGIESKVQRIELRTVSVPEALTVREHHKVELCAACRSKVYAALQPLPEVAELPHGGACEPNELPGGEA